MEKKNKTLILIVGILLVIVVGASFAYFLVSVAINGNGANTKISTGSLPLVQYDAGSNKLEKENFMPKDIISKEFKVIASSKNETIITYGI